MKTVKVVRGVMISWAAFGLCLPQLAFGAESTPAPPVLDVALSDGGVLHGRVVNLQGAGMASLPVFVKAQDRNIAAATTAADGAFSVQGLKGGVYQVSTVQGQGVYRLWAAGTAPPVAQTSAVVYTQGSAPDSGSVVYTQGYGGGGRLKMLLSNPIVVAGIVATAVAVPVALNQWHHTPVSP